MEKITLSDEIQQGTFLGAEKVKILFLYPESVRQCMRGLMKSLKKEIIKEVATMLQGGSYDITGRIDKTFRKCLGKELLK